MDRQIASRRRTLLRKVDFSETDIPTLVTAVETAMTEGGQRFKHVQITRNGREMGFRVEPYLPDWLQKLSDQMSVEGDNGAFGGALATNVPAGAITSNGQALSAQEQALLRGLFSKLGLT